MERLDMVLEALIMRVFPVFAPLSRVAAPLLDGLLRRVMRDLGAHAHDRVVGDAYLHYYHRPATARSGVLAPRLVRVASTLVPGWQQAPGRERVPIVLVHGLGDNALTWTTTLVLLAPGRDVYALDLPGYGFSHLPPRHAYVSISRMSDTLVEFLRDVVRQPALVVGNSMGAWIALRLAGRAPEWVREIVLINAGGAYLAGRPSWEPFRAVVAVEDLKTTREAIRQVVGLVPALFVYLGQASIQERFQRQVVRAFVAAADDRDFLTAEELRALPVPASIVWGMRDRFLPQGSLEFFLENLPNAPVLTINRCGHLPQRERPLAVARFIDHQADRIETTRPVPAQ